MTDPNPRRLPPASRGNEIARPQYMDIPGYGYDMPPEEPEGSGLAEYWNIISRRKGTLILITFVCVLTAILITLPQTPVYQARTTLEIQDVNQNFLNMQQVNPISEGAGSQPLTDLQTQIQIFQSKTLIERVLDRLKVTSGPRAEAGRLSDWRKALNLPASGPPETREGLVERTAGNLKVRASGQTRIIEVTFDSTDPQFAANFANNLTNEFIEQNIEARWKMNQRTGEWLSRQLGEMRIKLERSEDALQGYARRSALMFTGDKQSVSEEKLRQLQQELSKAQADRIANQSRFEMLRNAPLDLLPQATGDSAMREMQTRLADLRRQQAELTAAYTAQHYKVQRIQAQIASLEKSILEERTAVLGRIQKDYDGAQRREKLLSAGYDAQVRLVNQESEKSIQYNIFKREVDSNRQIYDAMLQRVKEASVAAAIRASNVRVVDAARPPRLPYKPRIVINAALGLLSGLLLGVAFIVVRERADRSIQDPGDLSFYLDVPELGYVPNASARPLGLGYVRHRKALQAASLGSPENSRVELVTWQKKPSLISESFRSLITSILFTGRNGDRAHVLVLTSPSPQEGKTTVASNLAIALAEINHRVVLIDADLRKPRLHEIFGLDNETGLSTYLAAWSPLETLARSTEIPNLTVITSGPASLAATSLLHSPRVKELLENLRKDYDMIVLDTPPMLEMSDARVLGRLADGVILVNRAGRTNRDAAVAARQRFAQDGTAVLGTILNDWKPRATRQGHYGHSKGYYHG